MLRGRAVEADELAEGGIGSRTLDKPARPT